MDEESDKEMFSNEQDVMETSLDASNTITGLTIVNTEECVKLTDVSASVALETEKREYPIEESEGVNVMEDTLRSDPAQVKRESVKEDGELNGLVTTLSPSG